jgi:hypothetical protein
MPDVMTISTQNKNDSLAAVAQPDSTSFHRIVASIIVMAQCFALLPVHGVTAPSPQALRLAELIILLLLLL